MAEAEAARDVGGAHQVHPQQLVERVQRGVLVHAGGGAGELGDERVARDRRALQQPPRAVAEQRELLAQRRGHVARDLAGAAERAGELLQVERVPAALDVHRVGGVAVQRLGVLAAERRQLDAGERPGAVGALERGQQLLRDLPRAHRERQQHRRLRWASQQRAEQLERARVGPVQVVEHQHQRLAGGEDAEQVADGLVRAVALVGHAARTRVQDAVELAVERLEHGGREAAHVLVERVDEDPERQVALELGRAARQHEAAAVVGHRLELRQQPRLADARLAHELDRARAALERIFEHAQLLRTPDELLCEMSHG